MTGDLARWADRITALVNDVDDVLFDSPDHDREYLLEGLTGALAQLATEMRGVAACTIPDCTMHDPVPGDART